MRRECPIILYLFQVIFIYILAFFSFLVPLVPSYFLFREAFKNYDVRVYFWICFSLAILLLPGALFLSILLAGMSVMMSDSF